jgi:hypothetical protein
MLPRHRGPAWAEGRGAMICVEVTKPQRIGTDVLFYFVGK